MQVRSLCLAICAALAPAHAQGQPHPTPQAAFKTLRKAVISKDYKALFSWTDPQEQDLGLLSVVFGADMMAGMMKDNVKRKKGARMLGAILKRHGLVQPKPKDFYGFKGDKLRLAAKRVFAAVKDRPALFSDLLKLLGRFGATRHISFEAEGTLKQVKVDGHRAKGMFFRKDGKRAPIHFVKREKAWYLSMKRTASAKMILPPKAATTP